MNASIPKLAASPKQMKHRKMRFYFDYTTKDRSLYDYQGEEFPNTEHAYDFAAATAETLKNRLNGEWLGWSIAVRNAEGRTYFSITVGSIGTNPALTHDNDLVASRTTDKSAFADSPAHLLIIEDVMTHGVVVDRIARKFGFVTEKAHSCDDACRALGVRPFDCITLDLVLGEHIGLDVLRYLSSIGCRAPIILISEADGDTREDVVQLGRALDLNICETVQKPIDLDALGTVLANVRRQIAASRS
ncbi:MAG: response regulator [Xanthobacteraceae bacterium]